MSDMLYLLEELVRDRKEHPKQGSYTNSLFDAGSTRIAQKVGEEAVEVVVASLGQGRKEQIGELSDLFYHVLVLMTNLNITLDDVCEELRERHG